MAGVLQKMAFIIVHYTHLWLLLSFIFSGLALWRLAALLHQHEERARETRFSFIAAIINLGLGITLWLLSNILS